MLSAADDLYGVSLHPANYSGSFVDPGDPSMMDIVVKNSDCETFAELHGHFPTQNMQAIQAATNTSLQTLQNEYNLLNANLDALIDQGVFLSIARLDIPGNSLSISLDADSAPESEALITGTIGSSGLRITWDGVPAFQDIDDGQDSGSQEILRLDPPRVPVYGGEDLTNNGESCSSNISVTAHAITYTVTAGHCFAGDLDRDESQNCSTTNDHKYCAAKSIGVKHWDPYFPGKTMWCDCVIVGDISANRATSSILDGNNQPLALSFYAALNQGHYGRGMLSCESGYREYHTYAGLICGTISDGSMTFEVSQPDGAGGKIHWWVKDGFRVEYPRGTPPLPGDSGAPCFGARGAQDRWALLGVHDASSSPFGFCSKAIHLFKPYPNASWWGLGPG
jgi:hypothetical protein